MIIALAGRRPDPVDALIPRFPLEKSPAVREHLLATFQELQATDLVVSASSGSDLLALAAAADSGMRCHIVLPFSAAEFRAISVVDRPGAKDWSTLFDQFVREAEATGHLLLLGADGTNPETFEESFRLANRAILDTARYLASTSSGQHEVRAIIVWEGQSRGANDLTENFALLAGELAIPLTEIHIR